MNRRIVVMSLLALSLGLMAVAAPNMSGTWVLDKAKSDPVRMGGGPGGGGGGGGQGGDVNITLVIKQSDNEITITRKMSMGGQERPAVDQKFTLDGKEATNPAGGRGGTFTAKATWDKDALVIAGTQKMSGPQGDFEIGVKDQYALSADGKVLTLTTTRSMQQGERTSKQVYNKE